MAKELPYYKFEVLPYLTGDICLERWELQGIFTNICAYYWSKDCQISFVVLFKKYKGYESLIQELIDLDIFKVDGDYLSIHFLNEQWASKETQKMVNAINGKLGGRPKKNKTETKPNGLFFDNPNNNRNETNIEYNKEEESIVKESKEELAFRESKSALISDILQFFNYTSSFNKKQQSLAMAFVESLTFHEKFDFFIEQFDSYKKLKLLDKFPHNFENFLGDQSDQFKNGKWDDNWTNKLKLYKEKDGKADKRNSGSRATVITSKGTSGYTDL